MGPPPAPRDSRVSRKASEAATRETGSAPIEAVFASFSSDAMAKGAVPGGERKPYAYGTPLGKDQGEIRRGGGHEQGIPSCPLSKASAYTTS